MFKTVKQQLQAAFAELSKNRTSMFIVDVDKDVMWDTYLNAFPEETRQEHNCNCCRQFIKNYGNLVAIVNDKVVSIWDFTSEGEFDNVISSMNSLISSATIKEVFVSDLANIGTDTSREKLEDGTIIKWEHWYLTLPAQFVNRNATSIEAAMGVARDNKNVLKRSLDEISVSTCETVLELISQNSLYRGEEFKGIVTEFMKLRVEYSKALDKDLYCWNKSQTLSQAACRIRNSAIGTLLVDISEGKELDHAVGAFERMVAPTNYKRPTALVTKRMIEEAEKAIVDLGYSESLGRRFAVLEDISVENLIFVNRAVKKSLGVFDELKEDLPVNPKTLAKVEEISIDKFLSDILPQTKSLEVLFENTHLSNLVSVISPENKEAPSMFKWDNLFSWSYTNAVTDSIKEQVKAAGGNVDGELRVSLSWFNSDDLDLHVVEPNGKEIYFGHQRSLFSGGFLDVDMNAGGRQSKTPVENIAWNNRSSMLEGTYKVKVNNFNKRSSSDVGFTIQVECQGNTSNFDHPFAVASRATIDVVEFNYTKANGIVFKGDVKTSTMSKEKWGIETNKFQKVSMIMNSPNHWTNESGNKHLFFILEGAKSDESARGFFNEFLKEDLLKNKRVFEVLGAKLKVEPSDSQLSGLGFSSTQKNHIICKVTGSFERVLKIIM